MNREAMRWLSRTDPVLGQWVKRLGPIELTPRRQSPFQSLTRAVIYQQLSGKAADTIYGRFLALFPGVAFPTPHQVLSSTPETLRTCGLSRPKAGYVRGLAEAALNGGVPSLSACDAMADAELLANLTQLKGVGRWTAEMLLIFNLGRPDVLPVLDLGVRRGFQIAFRKRTLPSADQLDRIGERWRPHRTTAALYLWRAVDGAGGEGW